MGLNFYVACHYCKVKVFLYRGRESKPLHAFYHKHHDCGRKMPCPLHIQGDYYEQDWMHDYADDEEIQTLAEKVG